MKAASPLDIINIHFSPQIAGTFPADTIRVLAIIPSVYVGHVMVIRARVVHISPIYCILQPRKPLYLLINGSYGDQEGH